MELFLMRPSVKLFGAIAIATLILPAFQALGVSQELTFYDRTLAFNVAGRIEIEPSQRDEDASQREYEEALKRKKIRLEEQIRLCTNQASCDDRAEIAIELSNVYFELGEYPKTIDLLSQTLQEARDSGDTRLEQDLLDGIQVHLNQNWEFKAAYGIARNRRLWDLYASGKIAWQEVIEISELNLFAAREVGDISHQVDSIHGLGWSYRNLALYAKSLDLYEEALSVTKENLLGVDLENQELRRDLSFREFFLLTELGILYVDLAQHDRAITTLEESFEKAIRYGELYAFPAVHSNIYTTEVFQGFALYNIGIAYLRKGNLDVALEYFIDVRDNYPPFDGGGLALNIGTIYFDSSRYEEAAESFEQASSLRFIGDPGLQGFALNALGRSRIELGNYEQGFENYQSALAFFRELNDPLGESQTLSNIAALAEKQNEPQLAILLYKEAVNILESIRANLVDLPMEVQHSYTESISDTYRRLADLLLQENRIIEAQRVLDLLKVQELDDYIRGVERTGATETGVDFLRPEETILARYDAFQQSAIAAGQELDELKDIPAAQRSDEQVQRIAQLTDLLDDINGDFRDFASSPEIRELIDQLSYEARDASLSLNQLDRLRDELQQLNAAIFYPLILDDRLELGRCSIWG